MQVIGHRGCSDHFPENTIAAVRGAAPHVDMVEIDVRRCGSGELVVFHDERLDRLTDTTGVVHERPYDELSTLTVDGSEEPIPALEDVLEAAPDSIGLNIELKQPGMADDVLSLLPAFDGTVLISAFDAAVISPFRGEAVSTAYLCSEAFEESLDTAVELGCDAIHPHYALVREKAVDRAHERDLAVNAWTVPTSKAVARLCRAGVDGVIVDSWELQGYGGGPPGQK